MPKPVNANHLTPAVIIIDDQPRTMSTDVAAFFGKNHKDVLRQIRQIVDNYQELLDERNFAPVEIKDAKGEARPAYSMTRDGFTLLAMGFTGRKALQWKVKYIEAFNRMESALKKRDDAIHQRLDALEDVIGFSAKKAVFTSHASKPATPAIPAPLSPMQVFIIKHVLSRPVSWRTLLNNTWGSTRKEKQDALSDLEYRGIIEGVFTNLPGGKHWKLSIPRDEAQRLINNI